MLKKRDRFYCWRFKIKAQ